MWKFAHALQVNPGEEQIARKGGTDFGHIQTGVFVSFSVFHDVFDLFSVDQGTTNVPGLLDLTTEAVDEINHLKIIAYMRGPKMMRPMFNLGSR
jgi:hypothetical protein